MAKTTATSGTSNGNPTGNAEVPNASKKSRIREAMASPTPDDNPAGKATGKSVAKGKTGDTTGAGKMPVSETKASIILKKLNSAKGTTMEAMMQATGWQAHSVRGFLSAVVRKKLGQNMISEAEKDGVRRYGIQSDGRLSELGGNDGHRGPRSPHTCARSADRDRDRRARRSRHR